MRRIMLGVLGVAVAVGSASAQRLTDKERRDREARLDSLRTEMRRLERELGRGDFFSAITGPIAYTIGVGRPRLGVVVRTDPDPETDSIGAVLQAVTPDGPAATAGLKADDIVTRFNGERLTSGRGGTSPGNRLIELAGRLDEGDTARVEYRRGKEIHNATVVARTLGNEGFFGLRTTEPLRAQVAYGRTLNPATVSAYQIDANGLLRALGRGWSDMELTTLDADLGSYFGTTEGLLVVRAPRDSLLNLKSGDVILRIGGRVPSNPSQVIRILRSYEPGDEIRLDIMRNKGRTQVTATVPERERGLHWEVR